MLCIHTALVVTLPVRFFEYGVSIFAFLGEIAEKLRKILAGSPITLLYSEVPLRLEPASTTPETTQGTQLKSKELSDTTAENRAILYVGGGSLGLTNILMTHSSSEVNYYI